MHTPDHLAGEAMNSHFQLIHARSHSDELQRRAAAARLAAAGRRAPASGALPASVDVIIRLADPGDTVELVRLAQLDGRRIPSGRVLVAVVEGAVLAALPLSEGGKLQRPLADPFRPTAALVELLWLRASHLRGEPPARKGLLERLAGRLRGLRPRAAGEAQPGCLSSHAPASPANSTFLIR
jgi:hypothetical protein